MTNKHKNMATLKIKFRPSTTIPNQGTLYFQVIHKRVVRQIATPYRTQQQSWQQTAPTLLHNEYQQLTHIITTLNQAGKPYTADHIVNQYHQHTNQQTLTAYMQSIIQQLQQNKQQSTARNYQSTLNSLMRYTNHNDIPLYTLDALKIQSYEAWLKTTGICRNTSSFYLRILRAVYNRAVEQNLIPQQNPFRHTYTGIDKTHKRAINLNNIRQLKTAQLPPHSPQDLARDMFLLSFYLRGMSFIDMANLPKTALRNGYLHYTRSKTQQKITIKWEPIMQQILEKYKNQTATTPYLLPLRTHDDLYNKEYHNLQTNINYHLKKIAQQIGIPHNLTHYVARHTWASVARNNNIPISIISEALGHDSETTTQIYLLSIQTNEVDKANASILDKLA